MDALAMAHVEVSFFSPVALFAPVFFAYFCISVVANMNCNVSTRPVASR